VDSFVDSLPEQPLPLRLSWTFPGLTRCAARAESAEVMFRQVNKISQKIEYYVHFEECALPNRAFFAVDSFRVTRALTQAKPSVAH